MSKFRRLSITHALMTAGDAAMIVALADSFFFSIDLDAARTRVMLFLAISFAPFLIVAPLIGPLIDRMPGGRRLVIQMVALLRAVLLLLMAQDVGGLELFPLAFASLVLQKTYAVSKSAIVPSTVRSKTELVEANSKLGLVAGLTGVVAVIPAAILLGLSGPELALVYGALLFVAAFASARRLAPEVVAATEADDVERLELQSPSLRAAAMAMIVLRADVGFIFFHLAFWLRTVDNGTAWFGASIGASAIATMIGNAIAPRVRQVMREETMLTVSLGASAVAGIGFAALGNPAAGVALAGVVGCAAAIGRLAFESIVQRDAPEANQGRAFAVFETKFQFAWAAAAFVAVAIQAPGAVGLLIVGLVASGAMLYLQLRDGQLRRSRRRSRRRRSRGARPSAAPRRSAGSKGTGPSRSRRATRGPTRGPAPQSRSQWESPPDR
jgi:hypothetical protein